MEPKQIIDIILRYLISAVMIGPALCMLVFSDCMRFGFTEECQWNILSILSVLSTSILYLGNFITINLSTCIPIVSCMLCLCGLSPLIKAYKELSRGLLKPKTPIFAIIVAYALLAIMIGPLMCYMVFINCRRYGLTGQCQSNILLTLFAINTPVLYIADYVTVGSDTLMSAVSIITCILGLARLIDYFRRTLE